MKSYLLVKDNLEKKQLCDNTITLQIVSQIRILTALDYREQVWFKLLESTGLHTYWLVVGFNIFCVFYSDFKIDFFFFCS